MSDYILVQHEPPLATIIFNRPDRRNAISYGMWRELASTLADLDSDQAIRTIVLPGLVTRHFRRGPTLQISKNIGQTPKKGPCTTTP